MKELPKLTEEDINEIVKEYYGFSVEEADEMIGNLSLRVKQLEYNNEKLKEKNTIYKSTIKGQHKKIEELKNAKRISKKVHKERYRKLQEENEQLKKDKKFYADACVNLRNRNDKAIEVIDTQMKLAEDGVKENLRIIKFYLIKGECSVYDLTTEEDYKYKGINND